MAELPPFLRTRWARNLAIAVLLLLVLRIALPWILQAGIGWGGERALGVGVGVANVDLGVLRGRVVLDGLAIAGPGSAPTPEGSVEAETALLRWDRLEVNLEWLELLRGRLRLSELLLAGPTARIELNEDGAPIIPGPPRDAEAPEPPEDDADGAGWPILVDRVELSRLDVRVLDGQATPAVEVGLEALRLADISLTQDGLGLGAIGFEAPSLRVRHDFVLAAPTQAEPEPAQPVTQAAVPSAPESTPTHRMDELHIERAEFTLLTPAGPLRVAIQVDASDITTEPGVQFPASIRLEVEDGVIEIAGDVGISPPVAQVQLDWRDLPLPPGTLMTRPELASWIASLRASGELAVDFRLEAEGDAPAGVNLRGKAVFDEMLFRDPESQDLSVGWKHFEIPIEKVFVPLGESAGTSPLQVALGAVVLVAPHVTFHQPTTALETLMPPTPEEIEEPADSDESPDESPNESPGPEPIISVASFDLVEGELSYQDGSLQPPYAGAIRELSVSVRDVRLPAQTVGELSLSALLPTRSTLSIKGTHGSNSSNLTADLGRLALAPLNPYAIDAAGYRVDEGHLSLETSAKRTGEQWEVSNELVLHKLGLSSTGTGKLDQIIGVPVDLAMALLRDLDGDISLGIPVGFDRGGVRVGVGKIVRDALQAAIMGAVTSPLKMMGATLSMVSGGGLAIDPVRMEPGSTNLAEGQEESLQALVTLFESRPALAIQLVGHATPDDRDPLAEQILIERIAVDEGLPDLEDTTFFARRRVRRALERATDGRADALDGEDLDLLRRYVAATDVPPERFVALARARASALSVLLTESHGLTAERIRVADETRTGQMGVEISFEAL